MARLGILRTGAVWFAARNGAFGQGAATHGFGLSQFGGELAEARGRRCMVHEAILRLYRP